jgi:hypothetical protein
MADITMCASIDCPLAKKCYRKLAVKNLYYQSYADFKPKEGECEGYTPINVYDGGQKFILSVIWDFKPDDGECAGYTPANIYNEQAESDN